MIINRITTRNEEETLRTGADFSKLLKRGDVVLLQGELGSGKTRFVKGISIGLGIADEREVTSPSFTLLQRYEAQIPIYHMDYYRLSSFKEALGAGLDPFLYEDGVVLVEWGDKFPELFMEPHFKVEIRMIGEDTREIIIEKIEDAAEFGSEKLKSEEMQEWL